MNFGFVFIILLPLTMTETEEQLIDELFGHESGHNSTPMPPNSPEYAWTPPVYELSAQSTPVIASPQPRRILPRVINVPIRGLEYLFDGRAQRRNEEAQRHQRRDNMARKAEEMRIALHHTGSKEVVYEPTFNPLPLSTAWTKACARYATTQRIISKPLEPFRIREGQPFTKDEALSVIQMVARDTSLLMEERKQEVIDLMNAFFIKINTNGVPHVGMILPSCDNAMKGRMILSQKPADAWLKSTCYEVLFSVHCPDGYTDHHESAMRALFGCALVTATNKKDTREGGQKGGRPPPKRKRGDESDEGEQLQDVWDVNIPARVKEGQSVKQIAVHLAKMWYNCPNARACEGTYFRPLLDDPDHGYKLNLFEGWTWKQEEVKGEYMRQETIAEANDNKVPTAVDMWNHHVKVVMANGNEEFAEWLHYFAWHLLMRPAEPWEGVPVLVGVQGCGKNNWFKVLEGIIGQHLAMVTARMDDVVGPFTDRLENKMVVLLDEAKRDNGGNIGSYMKVLVTDLQYRLRKMYHPVSFADKYFRIVVFSNYEDVLEVEPGERRYFMNRCSGVYKGDTAYHRDFVDLCHSEEGLKAIYDWYAHHYEWRQPHAKFQSGRILVRTELLMDQQLSSMPPHFRWLYDALFAGQLVNPNRLRDAKDPVIAALRKAFTLNADDIAEDLKKKGLNLPAAKWLAEANSRRCWVQVISINDLYRSYEHAYIRLHGRGQHKSINQLLHTIQELLGGRDPVFEIPLLKKADIAKLTNGTRDLDAFVRVHVTEGGDKPVNSYGDVTQPTIGSFFKTNAVPESDYYVVLPILKVCQDNFCEHFGFQDNIWQKFRDVEELNTILQARLEAVPKDGAQEDIYKARDDALNRVFDFIPDKEEWDKHRAYIMGDLAEQ
jgi:hypothetical protein